MRFFFVTFFFLRFQVKIFSIQVGGQGIIAEFCQELVEVLKPLMKMKDLDFTQCLPHPHIPDFQKYKIILFLIILTWILLFLEPYALRFKNLIMEHYYPEISHHRTVWLYHEILRKRTSFLKFARRQARKRLSNAKSEKKEPMTFTQIFISKISRYDKSTIKV